VTDFVPLCGGSHSIRGKDRYIGRTQWAQAFDREVYIWIEKRIIAFVKQFFLSKTFYISV